MRLFSEEVTPTFTNSNLNIITVKDFTEVFFDVYELEINGKKYVTEKVAEYKGLPVISTSVIIDDKEYTGSFVLNKGNFEVLINKENLTFQQNVEDEFSELLAENYKTEEVDELIFEKRETIIEDIKNAKLSAKRYINKLKQKQIEEATKIHQEKLNEFNSELQEIRQGLVEEFVRVASSVKSDISVANDKESEKLRDYITERVTILAESLESNLDTKVDELEAYINERVNDISTDIVSGVIATEIKSCNNRLDENIDSLFNHINLKLTELIKEHEVLTTAKVNSIVSVIDDKLSTLDQVSIELNNSIQKSSNKALSRIGNVKTKLEEEIAKNVSVLQHDIDQASTRIKDYYDEKLNSLNEAVGTLSNETKQECIKLISESRDSLLQVISEIKTDVPNIIIEKKDGTGKEIDLKKVKQELEKSITTKFSTEVMSLKRMMEMMSGGGSVAKQFAAGGTMNGNLTVVGTISASQYLGIPGGGGVSGDYLPLSGGTLTGPLAIQGSLSADSSSGVAHNVIGNLNLTGVGSNQLTVNYQNTVSITGGEGVTISTNPSKLITLNGDVNVTKSLNVLSGISTSNITATGNISASTANFNTVSAVEYDVTGTDGTITSTTDILTWVLGSKSFAIGTNNTEDLYFKPDGSIMYLVIAGTTDAVRAYPLSASWDVTTASAFTSKSVLSLDTNARGLHFSPDGTNMFVTGNATAGGIIGKYTIPLSAAWNISQASTNAVQTLSLSAAVNNSSAIDPSAIYFKPDGLKMFVLDGGTDRVYEFNLSSAWQLSSVTYDGVFRDSIDSIPVGLSINKDGTRMFILGGASDRIQEVRLNTAWSLSSTTFVNASLFTTPDGGPTGVYFNDESYKCFTTGNSNTVREVLIGPNLSITGTNSTLRIGDLSATKTITADGFITANTLVTTNATNNTTGIQMNGNTNLTWTGGASQRIQGFSGRISFGSGVTEWGRFSGAQFRCANFQVGAGTDNGTVSFTSPSIGTLTMAGVGGDFNILQLGGITASFPAIKRVSAEAHFKTADDLNYTTIRAGGYKSSDGSTGADGSFTTADGKTITVKNGLITSIVTPP
jgi:hypothetical protein